MNSTRADEQLSQDELESLRQEALRRQLERTCNYDSQGAAGDTTGDNYDGGLAFSQILAVLAMGVAALLWLFPNPITIFAGAWSVVVLFVFNAINQKHQRDVAWQRADFRSKPSNSNLWILGLPLIMGVVAYAFVGQLVMHLDKAILARSVAVFLCTICSGAALASKALQGRLNEKCIAVLNGIVFGAALATAAVFASLAVVSGHYWQYSAALVVPLVGVCCSFGMIKRHLLRVERAKAFSIFLHSLFAAAAVFVVGAAPEARDFGISIGERTAGSPDRTQADLGLGLLSILDAKSDVERDCNPGAAPLPSLFSLLAPIQPAQANKVYFLMTGKPGFRSQSPVTGEDLLKGESTVGAVRKGLSLQDSLLTGHVDSQSATAVLYWTMVFHNQTEAAEEARTAIALPHGSTVSRVTLWVNGVPQEAAFNSTARVKEAYQWIVKRHRDPVLVTETAPDQVTLQAFPVPKWGDMKVRIGITCPLQPQSRRTFNLSAPHLVSANFEYKNASSDVKFESNGYITANIEELKLERAPSGSAKGEHILTGSLNVAGAKDYSFSSTRTTDFDQIATRASHSAEDSVISERLIATPRESLHKLAVVVETNTLLGDEKKDLTSWLKALPGNIDAQGIFASRHEGATPLPISQFVSKLDTISLDPGNEDGAALDQARDLIASDKHGAILWIHGPQPLVFQDEESDLKALMNRGSRRLKIYDCPIGWARSNEIMNYMQALDASASPRFISVNNSRSLKESLSNLAQSQFSAGDDLIVERTKVANSHSLPVVQDFPTVSRVSSIWAADEARKAARLGDQSTAVLLGTAYRVVTPVTGAVVMETENDYQYQQLKRDFYNVVKANAKALRGTADGTSTVAENPAQAQANLFSQGMFSSSPAPVPPPAVSLSTQSMSPISSAINSVSNYWGGDAALFNGGGPAQGDIFASGANTMQAPSLQGATNGTIGPQGNDATFVVGVNTSGTVRVNNLGNLEALLNILANIVLFIGSAWGSVALLKGVFGKSNAKNAKNLIYGSAAVLVGLMSPATVSFLLAVARDANLFS